MLSSAAKIMKSAAKKAKIMNSATIPDKIMNSAAKKAKLMNSAKLKRYSVIKKSHFLSSHIIFHNRAKACME